MIVLFANVLAGIVLFRNHAFIFTKLACIYVSKNIVILLEILFLFVINHHHLAGYLSVYRNGLIV